MIPTPRLLRLSKLRCTRRRLAAVALSVTVLPTTASAQDRNEGTAFTVSISGIQRLDEFLSEPSAAAKAFLQRKIREGSATAAGWFGPGAETTSAVARNLVSYQRKNVDALGNQIRDFGTSDRRELGDALEWSFGEGYRDLASDAKEALLRGAPRPVRGFMESINSGFEKMQEAVGAADYAAGRTQNAIDRAASALREYIGPGSNYGLEPGAVDAAGSAASADPARTSKQIRQFVSDLPGSFGPPDRSSGESRSIEPSTPGTLGTPGLLEGVGEAYPALKPILKRRAASATQYARSDSPNSTRSPYLDYQPDTTGGHILTQCPDGRWISIRFGLVWSLESAAAMCEPATKTDSTPKRADMLDLLRKATSGCRECAQSSASSDDSQPTQTVLSSFAPQSSVPARSGESGARDALLSGLVGALAERTSPLNTGASGSCGSCEAVVQAARRISNEGTAEVNRMQARGASLCEISRFSIRQGQQGLTLTQCGCPEGAAEFRNFLADARRLEAETCR